MSSQRNPHRRRFAEQVIALDSLEPRKLFAAPSVTSASFDAQSRHALVFTFSGDVNASLDVSDLVVQNLTDRTTLQQDEVALSYNADTNTATFTFPFFANGQLPPGNYFATLHHDAITDATGAALAADATVSGFVLPGDANQDRAVDLTDFTILTANFNATGRDLSHGDFNADGAVDLTDFTILAANFNRRLAPAMAASRAFDVCTFYENAEFSTNYFRQPQFDVLNAPDPANGGRFLCMGTDAHRAEIAANGNFLGAYYNTLNSPGYLKTTPDEKADQIQQYVVSNFTSTGEQPTYVVLNEISSGAWPNTPAYRTWLKGVVYRLNVVYGHEVILFSPFPTPANNAADWQYLAQYSTIAVENYLSGAEMAAQNDSVSWAQSQYQRSLSAYQNNVAVPWDRLILAEDFAQSTAGNGWGRDGVDAAAWDAAITARSTAAHNLHFAGFISYAWSGNQMQASEADLVHFEQTYRAATLP
jgi:hypothetical protein